MEPEISQNSDKQISLGMQRCPLMYSKAQNHRTPRTRCAPAPRITHLPTQPTWPNAPPTHRTGTSGGAPPPFWRGVPPTGSEFCQWGHHGLHIGGIFGIIPKQFFCPWAKPPSGHVCFCVLLVSCGELCMLFVYCRNQRRPTDVCFVFGLADVRHMILVCLF